jgi:hypothetical protein
MSHSRSSKATADKHGSYSFECRDLDGNVFRAQDGFATAQEADRAAERAERDMMAQRSAGMPISDEINAMTDDDLLRELQSGD